MPAILKDHVIQAYQFGSEEGRVVPDRYWRDVGTIDDKATVSKSLLFEGVYVGEGGILQNCIVDKNVRIPAMTQIGVDVEEDKQRFTVSENGIVVVPEGYIF